MNRENLRKLDEFFFSYEMRMARAWGWLTVVMLFAFILALKLPELSWLDFPAGLGVFWGIFEAGRWTLRATIYREYYAQLEAENESEDDYVEEAQPVQEVVTPRLNRELIDEDVIQSRAKFWAFVYYVCEQGLVSETAWEQRGLSVGRCRQWIKILEDLGIVTPTSQGRVRKVLMTKEEALRTIAQDVYNKTGIEDYWKPVRGYYNPASSGNSLLVLSDSL
jgi:hypothetical protein